MDCGIKYNLDLPEKVENILNADFWVYDHLTSSMLVNTTDPVKFTSRVSVFLRKGRCMVEINLIPYELEAPCLVNIAGDQILQMRSISEDFDVSFIVMSKRFCDNLFLLMQDSRVYPVAAGTPIVEIPEELTDDFDEFYKHLTKIFADTGNKYSYQAMVLYITSFFFETAHKCFLKHFETYPAGGSRALDRFMTLIHQHYKKERFLDFYAEKMQVTPKHLSRTIKSLTGLSAVEWIEKYVVLEAKVLLKSTNLTIQQISDELNFPSQSSFGKYFKKKVGVSPKDFRNR